ncbi:MAG TPA: hypothetical protein VFJ02_00990 [Vicinamibacterales bacterium]|nr:hypothetical protein [Vicinamibacterales bacterium]
MAVHVQRPSRGPDSGIAAALEHPAPGAPGPRNNGGELKQVSRAIDPRVVDRVRGEFREMPGFSPTLAQAARMFAIPTDDCVRVLSLLVREGFLRCAPDGQYRITARR